MNAGTATGPRGCFASFQVPVSHSEGTGSSLSSSGVQGNDTLRNTRLVDTELSFHPPILEARYSE